MIGQIPMDDSTLFTVRELRSEVSRTRAMLPPGPQLFAVDDLTIPTPDGPLELRVYRPAPDDPPGTVVYLHGGGWVAGSVDGNDALIRSLALQSRCEYVGVRYRLAPESPFPAAVDDAYAALLFAAGRGRPLIVHGDSAGGTIAAACALRCRTRGGPRLTLQMLVYPATSWRLDTASCVEYAEGHSLTTADMRWFWDLYVRDDAQRETEEASPLLADDVSALAPAFVLTAEHDPLRDEGIAYAERLRAAGVPVTHSHYDGVDHGFVVCTAAGDRTRDAVDEIAAAVAAAARAGAAA